MSAPTRFPYVLGPRELEVLRIIWAHDGPVTVRQVFDVINARRPREGQLAYTTVQTVMHRLTAPNKGLLVALDTRLGASTQFQPTTDRTTLLARSFAEAAAELGTTEAEQQHAFVLFQELARG